MSLFNPYVLLSLVLAILASFGGGYYKGGQDEFAKQQMEIARLNTEAREVERKMAQDANELATKLKKAEEDAKVQQNKLRADLNSGALKLRIPVKQAACPTLSASADAPAPAGDSVQANAELDGKTSQALVSITDDGDKAIRQLNACIDAYNTVYQTMRGHQ